MPVRIRTKSRLQGSVTPAALNQETDIINLSDQTDDYIVEGQISLQNMASGDAVVIKTYIAVDGTNQRQVDQITLTGAQTIPVVRVPSCTVAYNGKFRVTITQTAGTTLKAFPYTFIVQIMEVI
jgi:hypothetical protein